MRTMKLLDRRAISRHFAAVATAALLLTGLTVPSAALADAPADGTGSINLAQGKVASASSVYQGQSKYTAARAVDGQLTSRWASDPSSSEHWLQVDLGQAFEIDRVAFVEFRSRITAYTIQYSLDGEAWTDAVSGTKVAEKPDAHVDIPLAEVVSARFVRLAMDEVSEGPTVYEFEVYGEVPIGGAEHFATTPDELRAAIAIALPGDTITMADGTWSDIYIELSAYTTAEHPVTLRAETTGGVIITGQSALTLNRPNLVVNGLTFQDGTVPAGIDSIITFNSDYGQVSNISIIDFNPVEVATSYYWVLFRGANNRLDHSLLSGKDHHQPLIGNMNTGIELYNTVDHNYIKNVVNNGLNGTEALRIWGYGGDGQLDTDKGAFFTVEYNLFEHVDGDDEIISLKSNHNTVRYNTIIESSGGIVGRSGNYNTITNNIVIGNDYPGSTGIRVSGDHHTVTNNLVTGVAGHGLLVTTGEHVLDENFEPDYLTPDFVPLARAASPYEFVFHYGQVTDSLFANNAFIDNAQDDINVGFFYKNHWPEYQMVLLPERNTFSGNFIYKPGGGVAVTTVAPETTAPLDIFSFEANTFRGNVALGGTVSVNAPSSPKGILHIPLNGSSRSMDALLTRFAPAIADGSAALTASQVGPGTE